MGLSLGNFTHKIFDQINPFDNGATYQNPNPKPQPVAPGQPVRPAPSVLQQIGHDAGTVAGAVVKPVIQFPLDLGSQIASSPLFGAGKVTPTQISPVKSLAKKVGATGSVHQTVGSGLQTALTLGSGGLSNAIENGASRIIPAVAPKIVAKVAPKVVSNAALGSAFNATAATSAGEKPGQIVKAGAEGTSAGLIPVVGAAVRPVVRLAGKSLDNIHLPTPEALPAEPTPVVPKEKSVAPAEQLVTPTQKAEATIASQNAPEGTIATPKTQGANTSMPNLNQAINDVSADYATKATHAADAPIQDIVGKASNQSTISGRVVGNLRKALAKEFSKEENTQIRDILDNHPGALEAATPRAIEGAKALKPLYDQAFKVRQAIDPKINRIQDYITRLRARAVGTVVKGGSDVMGKIRNLSDITNLKSVFSLSRQDGKFIDKNGKVVYGNPTKLGLTQHKDGTITDAQGNSFKRAIVSTQNLEDATGVRYEKQISRLAGVYHTDTLSLKARAEALQALQKNPSSHGLYTIQEVDAGALGGRTKAYPVDTVDELRTPDGKSYYASKEDAQALSDNFGHPTPNNDPAILKAYEAASNVAQQSIVINFLIHTLNEFSNMLSGAGNLPGLKGIPGHGMITVLKNVINQNEGDVRDFLSNSDNHSSTFGKDLENVLSRATNGKSKFNGKLMAAIELRFRTALYKSGLQKNMTPKAAAENVNRFFGDKKAINQVVRDLTLFPHFLKTQAKIIYRQGRHPIEQRGSIANTALLAAALYGLDKAFQQATGNPNANLGPRGELSLLKQGGEVVKGVAQGKPSAVVNAVLNRANPVGKEIAQQASGTDFFTGQHLGGFKDRAGHVVSTTVAPAQTVGKVTSGKRSLAELAENQFNLNTPHAKGYQAAPKVGFLNTKGAITSKTGDTTGYQQQASYFNNLDTLKKSAAGNKSDTDALNSYLDRDHDPVTGQTIQASPEETKNNAAALATKNGLRVNVQKFEQSQPSHDPMWDLSPAKLATIMTYRSQLEGSAEKSNILANAQSGSDNWIKDLQTKQQTFYNNLPKLPEAKGSEANAQTPPYPVFDAHTTQIMNAYNSASTTDKTALEQQYGGELSTAFNQIAQWTNKMRVAQTGKDTPQMRAYPQADAATQAIINEYNNIPKGGGPKGGNAYRAAWITANPDAYAKMQSYLTQVSVNSLITNAAKAQFAGTQPNETLLKDIKNIGTYDIATTKNSDGTTSYALNPAAAAAQYAAATSSYTPYTKTASDQGYKDIRSLKYTNKIHTVSAKIKKPSIKLAKGTGGKARSKSSKGSKVAFKITPSKV